MYSSFRPSIPLRAILSIAIPATVSNITVPLLSLADTAIAGHLGAERYLGAIAVGSTLLNAIYWIFGFLRMGTSGLTAQAFGRKAEKEAFLLLLRSLGLALVVGAALILFRETLLFLAMRLIVCSEGVESLARSYFSICLFGAPFMLMLYGIHGWLIGMQNARYPLWISLFQNTLNIALSLIFAIGMDMRIEGVALGTLLSQVVGFCLALALVRRRYGRHWSRPSWRRVFGWRELSSFFGVNRDIFLRTLCLVAVMTCFTRAGAAEGDRILSANQLLMQLFLFFSYFMDGLAYAGEALCGSGKGAGERKAFASSVRGIFLLGGCLALLFALLYLLAGNLFFSVLTSEAAVRMVADTFLCWMPVVVLAGAAGFLLDGICVGVTATRCMLLSAAAGGVAFFVVHALLAPSLENHALWLAFVVYLSVRGAVEAACLPSIMDSVGKKDKKGI